jgi:hypothetical protein
MEILRNPHPVPRRRGAVSCSGGRRHTSCSCREHPSGSHHGASGGRDAARRTIRARSCTADRA